MQDSLKILEAVNNFYSQSFSQLVNITIAFLAFVGIVLPIIITLYQKRLFNLEHQVIEKTLDEKLEAKLSLIVSKVQFEYEKKEEKLEEKIAELEQDLNKEFILVKGGVMHVQAISYLQQGLILRALNCFVVATSHYIKADNNLNLRRTLNTINEKCFPKITSKQFLHNVELVNDIEKVMKELKIHDKNFIFSDLIKTFNTEYLKLKKNNNQRRRSK